MPPTMGPAMRCITSEPVPPPLLIGSRPAKITATVMAIGRTRSAAPSTIAARRSSRVEPVIVAARGHRLVHVEQHRDADFGRYAAERDEADGGGD